jgi:hypothetical protein
MTSKSAFRNGYDAFISHNCADKPWARELAERLSKIHFNGRPLRPWLDEQNLDPGNLGQEAELTTAIDRSRTLLLVLSPASINSQWVKFELEYFLRDRRLDEVVPLLKVSCERPAILAGAKPLDFTEAAQPERAFGELIERLCTFGGPGVAEANASITQAWRTALDADPGGPDAEPSPSRDALLAALLRFAVDNPATEGLALTGFWQAAQLLLRDHERDHPAAYNMKMLLGECLAVAVLQHPSYRQVAQRYLDSESAESDDPVLAFVVARAYSKLAEIDPTLIDLGALLRVATQLDARAAFNNEKRTVAMLLGRIAAKMRGTDLGDLLIQTLSEAGAAARIAAIGGITLGEAQAPSVFYLSKLAAFQGAPGATRSGALEPPSRKLQALLSGIDLDQPSVVASRLDIAKDDLRRAFAIEDIPYGYKWFALRTAPPAIHVHRQPFMGTVAKATTANMEELAYGLNASHAVCLTKPRIVEALFDRAGSLLIPLQDEDSPQCQRLRGRRVPFAMLDAEMMDQLKDGDHVVIERNRTRIVSQTCPIERRI